MKAANLICHAVAGAVIFSAAAVGAADMQQDRLQLHIDDPQYLQDKDRDQDRLRIHQDDQQNTGQQSPEEPIYGAELMTADEQAEYRNQYRKLQTVTEQKRFENQHRLLINTRAQSEGVAIQTGTAAQMENKAGATVNNQPSGSVMSGGSDKSDSMAGGHGGDNPSGGGDTGSANSGGKGGGGGKQ